MNDLITRVKLLRIHAVLLSHLKAQMPVMFGKQETQQKLVDDLVNIYSFLSSKYAIDPLDFPPVTFMREKLSHLDCSAFQRVKDSELALIDEVLTITIPAAWSALMHEESHTFTPIKTIKDENPRTTAWLSVPPNRSDYISDFEFLNPVSGKLSGAALKVEFSKYRLPNSVLHKIWSLADSDGDGNLDLHEYSIARHLIAMKLEGVDLPKSLPNHLRKNRLS